MAEDDVVENNLAALREAASVVESLRGVSPEDCPGEALVVLAIVTSLDAALFVYSNRRTS